MRPSITDVLSLALLLGFALIMADKLPLSGQSLSSLASVATFIGVWVSLYQIYMTRKEQKIAKALTEWTHAATIQSLVLRSRVVAEEAIEAGGILRVRQIEQIAREFDALNSVVSGNPGISILINIREIAFIMKRAIEDSQGHTEQYMNAVLATINLHQPSLRSWLTVTGKDLVRLGEPVPGVNS